MTHGEEGESFSPMLLVSKDPFVKVNADKKAQVPSPDFMLCASTTDFALAKAYFARFVHPKLQDKMVLWNGYINMGKPQILMQGTHTICSSLTCRILFTACVKKDSASTSSQVLPRPRPPPPRREPRASGCAVPRPRRPTTHSTCLA